MSSNMNNTNPHYQTAVKRNVIVASALYPGLNKETKKNAAGLQREGGQQKRKPVMLPPDTQFIPMGNNEVRKLRRAHRRNLSYFYVMRKFVCFLMAIFFVVYAVIAVLGIIPATAPYTAYVTIPDNTPWDVRDAAYDPTTGYIYIDQSVGIGAVDIIYGYISSLMGTADTSAQAAEEAAAEEETPVTEEAAPKINYYTTYLQLMEDRQTDFDATGKIFVLAYKYTPIAMVLAFLTMLITLFKSVFALRGRRIRRAFGLSAIIMLVSAGVTVIGLVGLSNAANANPNGLGDFSQLMSFFTNVFYGAPNTVAEALMYPYPALVGGLLVPVMIIVPIVTLLLSFFCRKREYYRLFNH